MENQVTISQPTMLEAMNRSEIDMQISTAHAFPRDEEKALAKMARLACMDEDTAADCFYQLKRKKADGEEEEINGLSVRMAEIIASCWGNLRVQARIIGNDGRWITAQGVCHDLESNYAVSKEVKRRITTKQGYTFSEDMQVVTGNAACAIAYRNAVLAVVPKAVTNSVINRVRAVMENAEMDVPKVRTKTLRWWASKGVTEEQILHYLQLDNIEAIDKEQLYSLRALAQAINEGTTSIEETFVAPVQQERVAKGVKSAAKAAKDKAEQAMARSKGKNATQAK